MKVVHEKPSDLRETPAPCESLDESVKLDAVGYFGSYVRLLGQHTKHQAGMIRDRVFKMPFKIHILPFNIV